MPTFRPARIVNAKDRTYILIYDRPHQQKPYRPTFQLNFISNLEVKQIRAEEILRKINAWLKAGNRFDKFDERTYDKSIKTKKKEKKEKKKRKKIKAKTKKHKHLKTPILEALEIARKFKCVSKRWTTNKTYNS